MTQFILTPDSLSVQPAWLATKPAHESSLARQVAQRYFPATAAWKLLIDPKSREADAIIDIVRYSPRRFTELTTLLKGQSPILCWYADDFEELPIYCTWRSFSQELARSIKLEPPEIYAILKAP